VINPNSYEAITGSIDAALDPLRQVALVERLAGARA
jgi:hypothetical protein